MFHIKVPHTIFFYNRLLRKFTLLKLYETKKNYLFYLLTMEFTDCPFFVPTKLSILFSGNQKPLTQLTHPFSYFYKVFLYILLNLFLSWIKLKYRCSLNVKEIINLYNVTNLSSKIRSLTSVTSMLIWS